MHPGLPIARLYSPNFLTEEQLTTLAASFRMQIWLPSDRTQHTDFRRLVLSSNNRPGRVCRQFYPFEHTGQLESLKAQGEKFTRWGKTSEKRATVEGLSNTLRSSLYCMNPGATEANL